MASMHRMDLHATTDYLPMVAGAALARSRTAPPSTLHDIANPDFANPTMLSTLVSTAYIEELGGDPSSPASTATGLPGLPSQSQVQPFLLLRTLLRKASTDSALLGLPTHCESRKATGLSACSQMSISGSTDLAELTWLTPSVDPPC